MSGHYTTCKCVYVEFNLKQERRDDLSKMIMVFFMLAAVTMYVSHNGFEIIWML